MNETRKLAMLRAVGAVRFAVIVGAVVVGVSVPAQADMFQNFNSTVLGADLNLGLADSWSQRGVGDYYNITTMPAGWTANSPGTYAWAPASDPSNIAILLNENGGLVTTLLGLTLHTDYVLTFKYWGDNRGAPANPNYILDVTVNGVTTPILGQDVPSPGDGTYNTAVIPFTYEGGSLSLTLAETPVQQASPIVDDITVSSVPEPGFYGFLAVGLSGLALVRRWNKSRKS